MKLQIILAAASTAALLASAAALPAAAQALSDPVVKAPDVEALFTSKDPKLNRNKQAAYHIVKELLECGEWSRAGWTLMAGAENERSRRQPGPLLIGWKGRNGSQLRRLQFGEDVKWSLLAHRRIGAAAAGLSGLELSSRPSAGRSALLGLVAASRLELLQQRPRRRLADSIELRAVRQRLRAPDRP